jgi:O-succinylbenzoate synthase
LRGKITAREGLIIKLVFDEGLEGFGEIAPLPGLSNVTLEECLGNLRETAFSLKKGQFSFDTLETDFFEKLDKIRLYPEVRFGIEMAVLNAAALLRELPLSKFLSAHAAQEVVLNGLLADADEPVEQEVERLLQDGYTLIKVKVGGEVYEDAKRLKAVVKAAHSRAHVHVDANQKWNLDEANLFAKELNGCTIKYIEEPFFDISKIPEFFRNTGIPVALDETIVRRGFAYSNPLEGVKFLVLKPTLIGGIRKVLRIMREAEKSGLQFVISSSFESGIGLFTLGHLAASAGKDVTAGLDTLKWFESDLLKNPLPISKGQINVSGKSVLESDIRIEYLTEV